MLLAALALFTGMTQSSHVSRRCLWFATAMLAALGGLTKEIAVVLPLATIAIDRALVAGSWRATLAHWRWHLAAAAAWPTIAVAALVLGGRGNSAGVLAGTSPWRYLLTQATAVWIYAGRILWPRGLVFDHGAPLSSGLAESWLPLVLAGVAVGAVALGYFFRPVRYLAPALFFLLLAPPTAIVPVKTQTIAEHRLYLPLAPLAAAVAASIAMTAARLMAETPSSGWYAREEAVTWRMIALAQGRLDDASALRRHRWPPRRSGPTAWQRAALFAGSVANSRSPSRISRSRSAGNPTPPPRGQTSATC